MGTLPSRKEADQLYEYITTNFPYLDRLEKNIVVDEEIADTVKTATAEKTISIWIFISCSRHGVAPVLKIIVIYRQ